MIQAALALIELGFAIFPVHTIRRSNGQCSCGKQDCKSPGKHPVASLTPKGLKEATKDPAVAKGWWTTMPDANIAIVTGLPSGIFVIDIDLKTGQDSAGGPDSLRRLVQLHGPLPDTVNALTGSGGAHLFFRHPAVIEGGDPDTRVINKVQAYGAEFPGIDIRGDGGYVVAAPSLHISGNAYQWDEEENPLHGAIIEIAPAWVTAEIVGPAAKAKGTKDKARPEPPTQLVTEIEIISEGNRNRKLFEIASSFRGRGLNHPEILALLREVNAQRCRPPLDDSEIQIIAGSAAKLAANRISRNELPKPVFEDPQRRDRTDHSGGIPTLASDRPLVDMGDDDDDEPIPKPPPPGRRLLDTDEEAGKGELPQIETGNRQLKEITRDALACLINANSPPWIFVRGGRLCKVTHDEAGVAKIETLEGDRLRYVMARTADWVKTTGKNATKISVPPPVDVVRDLEGCSPWRGIPRLRGISLCPAIGGDDSIQREAGYHKGSLYYIATRTTWPDFDASRAQGAIQNAEPEPRGMTAFRWLVDELLSDFPFEDAASLVNAVSLVLLPFVRPAIAGPTPFFLIDAPAAGTGKSLLAEVCLIPGALKVDATTIPEKEEEFKKVITSLLLDGQNAVLFDNIKAKVSSGALESVLTTTEWSDRLLGKQTTIRVPNLCIYVGTSNQAKLSPDLIRRSVYIRLNARRHDPAKRTGFKRSSLRDWVRENRGEIGAAALAMIETWIQAGKPIGAQIKGSYESWAGLLGGIFDACGVKGFLANEHVLAANTSADDNEAWDVFIGEWWERFGETAVTTKDLYAEFSSESDALKEILGSTGDDAEKRKRRLGQLVRHRIDAVFNFSGISENSNPTDGNANPTSTPNPTEKVSGINSVSGIRNFALTIGRATVRDGAPRFKITKLYSGNAPSVGLEGLTLTPYEESLGKFRINTGVIQENQENSIDKATAGPTNPPNPTSIGQDSDSGLDGRVQRVIL